MEKAPFVPGQIDAIVFDVIGTLVDDDATWMRTAEQLVVESGLSDPGALRARWVELLDERMSAVIAGEAPWRSHGRLIGDSAQDAITGLGGNATSATAALVASIEWEYVAWPDAAAATAALRRSRLVAGVSNGDLDSLARLANRNALSWDIALSTGAAQTFKPAPAAYRYAVETLAVDPVRTLFVASHPWDLRAAAGHGFRTAYVARPGADRPSEEDHFDLLVDDLSALPELLV